MISCDVTSCQRTKLRAENLCATTYIQGEKGPVETPALGKTRVIKEKGLVKRRRISTQSTYFIRLETAIVFVCIRRVLF